jgi:GNAT superfamily N-acetyltransferase
MDPGPRRDAVRDEEIAIAACSAADRDEQARLHAQCFKKPLSPRGLAWRYDDNPLGESVSFVARPPGGEAISGYACNARRAIHGGDEATLATVGETGDVMTHPDWRKRGVFSRLDRAAMEEARRRGWVLAFGLPNRKSAHIFVELGWERIGSVRGWTFVLRADAAAREVRAREGRLRAWFAGLDARKCAGGRRDLDAARQRFRRAQLERFPREVEDLSRAVEPRFAFMLRRDADYLNWRFVQAPSKLHRALGVFDGPALAGYAVVQLPRRGESTGYLVDVLGRDDTAIQACIGEALIELENERASLVQSTAIEGSWWSERLRAAGFLASRDDSALDVILHPLAPQHPLVAAARDASRWYFTDGDRDDETMG